MAVFYDIHQLPAFKNAVITIGTFDGVHKGHKAILNEVVNHAKQVNGESILLTFEPHPRKLLFPDQHQGLITPLDHKINLLQAAGIEHIVVVPFTKEFSQLSAQEYIENFLVKIFHPESIIIGHDHHFGHDRRGNIHMLKEYAAACNYRVVEIPAQLIDEAAVSSTKIRHAIMDGNMRETEHMLGRDYSLKGTVVKGNQLGRTIGYPTANIQPLDGDQLIPAMGIYVVRVRWNDTVYGGMLSIGFNPTVTDKKELKIEVNIFDFNHDIYGATLEIIFLQKFRNEEKFESVEALKVQLGKDEEIAREFLDMMP